MINRFKNTESVLTKEQLAEQLEQNQNDLTMRMVTVAKETEKLKISLAKMSRDLYGHENFLQKVSIWGTIFWIAALSVVAVVEIPLNAMSFEIFDRPQQETKAMAVAFGLLMATLAHFTGHGFKRSHVSDSSKIMGWVCVLIAVIAFAITASFRVQYMKAMNMQSELGFMTQFGFAIVVFMIGVIASYYHTSKVKNIDLEKAFKSELKRFKTLDQELKTLQKKRAILQDEYRKNFNAIEKMQKAEAARQQSDLQAKFEAEKVQNSEKMESFRNSEEKFNQAILEMNELISQFPGKKEDLTKDLNFIQIQARLEAFLNEASDAATEETIERLNDMRARLNIIGRNSNL